MRLVLELLTVDVTRLTNSHHGIQMVYQLVIDGIALLSTISHGDTLKKTLD